MPVAVRELSELVAVMPDGGDFWEVDFRPASPRSTCVAVTVELARPGTMRVVVLNGDSDLHDMAVRLSRTFEKVRAKPLPPTVRPDRVILQDVTPADVAKLAREIAEREGRCVEILVADETRTTPPLSTCESITTFAGCCK